MILTPQMLTELRETSRAAQKLVGSDSFWNNGRAHPGLVLALLDRIEGLESENSDLRLAALEFEERRDVE